MRENDGSAWLNSGGSFGGGLGGSGGGGGGFGPLDPQYPQVQKWGSSVVILARESDITSQLISSALDIPQRDEWSNQFDMVRQSISSAAGLLEGTSPISVQSTSFLRRYAVDRIYVRKHRLDELDRDAARRLRWTMIGNYPLPSHGKAAVNLLEVSFEFDVNRVLDVSYDSSKINAYDANEAVKALSAFFEACGGGTLVIQEMPSTSMSPSPQLDTDWN